MAAPSITQLFNPRIGEYGQDYAVPVGTPIYSPVGGTIGTEDKGKSAWGKRVLVFTDSTTKAATGVSTFAVGHLTKFAVSAGQKIQPGQLIGYSGGAVSDPSSGNSSGPHVEPQFFGASGAPINPLDIFKRFASWEQAIFTGAGAAAGAATSSGPDLNPLDGVASAIGAAAATTQKLATRAFFVVFGLALVTLGLVLIFFGDIERALQAGQHAAAAAGKVAATVAAPEVAVPAEAAEAAA